MLRGSEEFQDRVLIAIGTAVLLCALIAGLTAVTNPFAQRSSDHISLAIDTPYVGEGVKAGTPVVIHGVEIGQVTKVSSLPAGGVRLVTEVHKAPVSGLTDTMKIDFRPVNYFGVTGVNLIARPGGRALVDGSRIAIVPQGNFTLQAMLSRLGAVSAGALTPRLIEVIDRTSRYTDALDPMIETVMIVSQEIADVQRIPTAQLLANTTSVAVAFPTFTDLMVEAADRFINVNLPRGPAQSLGQPPFLEGVRVRSMADESEAYFNNVAKEFLNEASVGLFGAVGKLESSHVDDLLPVIESIKGISDVVPALVRPADVAQTLRELRLRIERMYSGSTEQRALNVRILLDSLPGVAAPFGMGEQR